MNAIERSNVMILTDIFWIIKSVNLKKIYSYKSNIYLWVFIILIFKIILQYKQYIIKISKHGSLKLNLNHIQILSFLWFKSEKWLLNILFTYIL